MKIKNVNYTHDYFIFIEFEDGVKGEVDLRELVHSGVFLRLKDQSLFAKVYSTGYSVAWSDDLEIDAANIYSELTGKDPAAFFAQASYAAD